VPITSYGDDESEARGRFDSSLDSASHKPPAAR
jgi:hypothetical protein